MTKKLTVIGKTMAVISLNKIGGYIRGKTPSVLTIDNEEKEAELNGLVRSDLVYIDTGVLPQMPEVVQQKEVVTKVEINIPTTIETSSDSKPEEIKGKIGRPKGSKNKIKKIASAKPAAQPVVESKSGPSKAEQMGGRVVVGTGNGNKEGKMKYSAIDDIVDSDSTRASIEAMKKLEEEEKTGKSRIETIIDENKLDVSEQMGRKAVVSNQGEASVTNMENSILPNSKEIKDRDPFIDEPEIEDNEDNANDAHNDSDGMELDDDDFLKL